MAQSGAQRAAAVNLRLANSAAAFNKAALAFCKNLTEDQLKLLHKKVALEALKRIVLRTPVDTGRARGNWQVTVDQPAPTKPVPNKVTGAKLTGKHTRTGKAQNALSSAVGNTAIAEGSKAIAAIKPFSTTFITNNVPYVIWLEDGSSKQAPQGMVKLTIEELRQIFP